MNIQPFGKRIIAKYFRRDEKTEGGIYIPETATDQENLFKVIKIGDGVTNLKPGDIFGIGNRLSGSVDEFNYMGETYKIFSEDQIVFKKT